MFFRKNTPTLRRGERWEDGEVGKGQGVIYKVYFFLWTCAVRGF